MPAAALCWSGGALVAVAGGPTFPRLSGYRYYFTSHETPAFP
jgi:hypothetical protein